MSNPRRSQGSRGDFFPLAKALAASLLIHLLLFGGFDRWALPGSVAAGAAKPRLHGSLVRAASPLAAGHRVQQNAAALSVPQVTAASEDSRSPLGNSRANGRSGAGGEADGGDPLPGGIDMTRYRLALGRAFGRLLDGDLRSELLHGELVFSLAYRAGDGRISAHLTARPDQRHVLELQRLMEQAAMAVPTPSAWRVRDYTLELRTVVDGA